MLNLRILASSIPLFNFLARNPSVAWLTKFTTPPAIPPISAPQGPPTAPPIAPLPDAIRLSAICPPIDLPLYGLTLLIRSILLACSKRIVLSPAENCRLESASIASNAGLTLNPERSEINLIVGSASLLPIIAALAVLYNWLGVSSGSVKFPNTPISNGPAASAITFAQLVPLLLCCWGASTGLIVGKFCGIFVVTVPLIAVPPFTGDINGVLVVLAIIVFLINIQI